MNKDYVLPEMWAVRITEENKNILERWRLKQPDVSKDYTTSDEDAFWLVKKHIADNTYMWFYKYVPITTYTEISFEEFNKYILKEMKEEKKIIGYKLIKPEYEEAAIKLSGFYQTAGKYIKLPYLPIDHWTLSISNWKRLGVLDLWFEAVYEEEKKPVTRWVFDPGGVYSKSLFPNDVFWAESYETKEEAMLKYAKVKYPVGTTFKSAYSGDECTVDKANHEWSTANDSIVNSIVISTNGFGRFLYYKPTDKWAEIVEPRKNKFPFGDVTVELNYEKREARIGNFNDKIEVVKAVLSFNQVREISNYLSNPPMILSHPLKINRYQIHSDTTISFGCVSGSVKELTNIVDAINENSN